MYHQPNFIGRFDKCLLRKIVFHKIYSNTDMIILGTALQTMDYSAEMCYNCFGAPAKSFRMLLASSMPARKSLVLKLKLSFTLLSIEMPNKDESRELEYTGYGGDHLVCQVGGQ